MADITKHFRATVKAVRLSAPSRDAPEADFPTRRRTSSNSEFAFRDLSGQLRSTLARAADIVHRSQESYLRISAERGGWSDLDNESLQGDAEKLISVCRAELARLSGGAMLGDDLPEQVRQHRRAVVDSLQTRLKGVGIALGEQMEIRNRRSAFQQRLAPSLRLRERKLAAARDNSPTRTALKDSLRDQTTDSDPSSSISAQRVAMEQDEASLRNQTLVSGHSLEAASEWSNAEEQELALENDILFEEMSSRLTDVRSLQSRVSEIARLQQTFTEKVISQAADIDRVATESVASTENVREGNEQLRDAMKNRASNRFWLLFFLIVLTLSLLFLDWYNA